MILTGKIITKQMTQAKDPRVKYKPIRTGYNIWQTVKRRTVVQGVTQRLSE